MVQSPDSPAIEDSDLLVSVLENEGVEFIFGALANENSEVVESLRTSKIKLVLTHLHKGPAVSCPVGTSALS
ncbi:hypothetical protein HFO61_07885 [Rhizobium leguminosarum]|uniref:hypothetical protein n=1 Tax=Rhizobium leguminosarum TaxID=384 RepID=UPI001A935683|nr:hypothetical protein [Rhizobium leguminosarum]MBY5412933.1 hypothetical protein [Rhizobium leguminosarum]MBY5546749.1 hypothetical protein [Rhizobium leguminosarum]MBY5558132.1 hypothetical protein [Rhizobium leguminosarum]QSW27856.1 hypothetical protein J0664_32430 [Rhizobium leguminosarum]